MHTNLGGQAKGFCGTKQDRKPSISHLFVFYETQTPETERFHMDDQSPSH